MTDLWMYFRRPSCRVRYRHGGTNAIYPMMMRLPRPQPRVSIQNGGSVEAASTPHDDADNVLPFVQPEQRTGRRTSHQRGPRGESFDPSKGNRRN